MIEQKSFPDRNTYALSTASWLDPSTVKEAASYGIQNYVDAAQKTGFDKVELWPQGLRPIWQIRLGLITPSERQGVSSMHQSVGKSMVEALALLTSVGLHKGPRGALRSPAFIEVQKAAFLPEINASLRDLDRIRKHFGNIPAILFKETPPEYFAKTMISNKYIQTDPETATAWNAQNAEQYIQKAAEHGFNGIVVDTHHIRRPDNNTKKVNPMANWEESLPQVVPVTPILHLGFGRDDFGSLDKQEIYNEALDFLNGGIKNTELNRMIRRTNDSGWKGLVVLETRPSTLKKIAPHMSMDNMHEEFRETLFNIFGH